MTSSNNFLFYHEAVKCKVSNVSRKGQQFRSVRTVVTVQVVNISFGLLTSASLSSWNSICGTSLRDVARNGPHRTRRGTVGLERHGSTVQSTMQTFSSPEAALLLVITSIKSCDSWCWLKGARPQVRWRRFTQARLSHTRESRASYARERGQAAGLIPKCVVKLLHLGNWSIRHPLWLNSRLCWLFSLAKLLP